MSTDEKIEKQLKEIKKGFWLYPIVTLLGGLALAFWLNLESEWLNLSEKFPILETHILKDLNQKTAIIIFLTLFTSVLFNVLQTINIYRLLLALIEKLQEKKDGFKT